MSSGDRVLRKSESGVLLLEMMIAMLILGIAVLGAIYSLVYASQMTEDARYRLLAAHTAKTVLEVVKDTPLTSLSGIDVSSYLPAELPNATISLVTNPANVAAASVATVTIRIRWTGTKNRARTLDISTMRSKY